MCNTNVSPEYFFDEMSWDEANAIIDECNNKYKNEWERARWQSYIMALTQGSKLKEPSDIMEFEWERKEIEEIKYSEEEIEKIKKNMLNAYLNNETKDIKELLL
jgi:glutamyl-tRNA reductase